LITDVFRSCPPLCTIHHLINFTLARVENVPVVPAVLDKGQADPVWWPEPEAAYDRSCGRGHLRVDPLHSAGAGADAEGVHMVVPSGDISLARGEEGTSLAKPALARMARWMSAIVAS
jgi:hypothetical protein